jgi:uncharacterized protein related to proFAR isomerase
MNIIPLVHINKRKIVNSDFNNLENIKDLLSGYEDDFIYILDHDGINKNRPNLCLFQKLSKKYNLWVDTGPRVIGDIVDSVIAGASKITVRENLINKRDTSIINEFIENEIYININLNFSSILDEYKIQSNVNGFVLLNNDVDHRYNFKSESYLKNIVKNNKTYYYLSKKENFHYIKNYDFEGYLIDVDKIKEYEKYWNLKQRK